MEFLHLDRKAHLEIKCVSWIEIVKELVKIFKARPQNHADRWHCLVGNRAMLTSRLAQFVKLVEYPLIASSKYLCKRSKCLIVPVMESFAVGWCLRCTEKALHNEPRRFRNPMVPLMGVIIKLNGTCLASVTKILLSSSTQTPIGVEHDAPVDFPLEVPSFPVPATTMTCSPVALKWMAVSTNTVPFRMPQHGRFQDSGQLRCATKR